MAKPFQKQKPKVSKDTGNYVFSNFTEGLYQLDTPRGLPEQLGSLAITDGRNVFTERGALIPQYGYLEKAKIPAGEAIVGVTEDSKSNSSVFIMCMSGSIYYYSSYNGLKKYKTVTDFLSEDIIYTRMNNNVVIGVGTNAFTFGGYYKESEYVEIINGANVQNFGSYITLEVPYKYEEYFWRGKIVAIPDVGAFNINSITASTAYTYSPIKFSSLNIDNEWTLEGEISVNDSKRNVMIDPATGFGLTIASKVIEGSETTTVTKEVTKYQCYKYTFDGTGNNKALTTNMKGIKKSGYFYTQGEAKLNKLLFRYEDGSKLAPDGYKLTQTTYTAQIATFTAKYQTGVQSMSGNSANKFGCKALNTKPVPDNFGYAGTLTRYPDGDVKETVTEKVPAGTSKTMYNVTFTIPLGSTTLTFTTADINAGTYTWSIHNDVANKKFVLQLKSGSTTIASKDLANTSSEQLKCYSQNPDGYSSNGIKLKDANGEVLNHELGGVLSMVATPYNEEVNMDNLNTNTCSVGEQTLLPITLVYKPEDKALPEQPIVPKLFGSATNRLLIYDVSGTIYYSAVGILDEFSEEAGAGYFRDFYNDTSECLGIEDYLNGCLITKQNGLYYVTINDLFNSQSVSADSTIGLNIKKVSEIGQEYAGDHIIVSDIVYAFDSNSGSLVIGCYQNAFGNVVSGEVLVPSEYVGSVDLGITEQRRKLVYSSEAEVFILYYGASMKDGLVLTKTGSLFPRQLNKPMFDFVRFNQGIMSVADDGSISMDFKRGTIVPELSPVAVFEQIGLAGSNLIQCSIIEVIELNGINYQLEVANAGVSVQKITSQMDVTVDNIGLPPLLYSTDTRKNDSFGTMPNEEDLSLKELSMIKDVTKWALKKSNLTRIYAPASGREGVRLTFEFQPNVAFCLVGIRLADFSRGE